jgi:hypothetical protein
VRVQIGEPGEEKLSRSVDQHCIAWHLHLGSRSDGPDESVADYHGVILEDALLVHGDYAHPYECDRSRGVRAARGDRPRGSGARDESENQRRVESASHSSGHRGARLMDVGRANQPLPTRGRGKSVATPRHQAPIPQL